MHSTGLPFSSDQLYDYFPSIHTAFVYEVNNDYSCMCAVRIHNYWYRQRIILRDILSIQKYSTIKCKQYERQHQACYKMMQDLILFRNISIFNVSYGNNGAFIADIDIANICINYEINTCIDGFNATNRKQYEESARFKLTQWLQQCITRMRNACSRSSHS